MNKSITIETTIAQEKAVEGRLRRRAEREGLMLVKSRTRDPLADDYGRYVLVTDSAGNRLGRYGGQAAVSDFAKGFGLTLEQIEGQLP
jgi:hypothetical protein